MTALLSALLEEYLFRATMLNYLDSRYSNISGLRTNAIASLVFSWAHTFTWPLAHAFLVFFPGLVLGFIWQQKKSLFACTAAHIAMNLVYATTLGIRGSDWSV